MQRDDIMKEIQNLKNYQNSNFSILNIMQMQLDYLNSREQEFVDPKVEEDKFSLKTLEKLLGENNIDVTNFSLEQSQFNSCVNNNTVQMNQTQNLNHSGVDLLSLLATPTPQAPSTPYSQKQIVQNEKIYEKQKIYYNKKQSTIFDKNNDVSNQNGQTNNSILSIPEIMNKNRSPKVNLEEKSQENKINFFEKESNTLNIDPRIAEVNMKIKNLNSSKISIQDRFLQVLEGLKEQTQDFIQCLQQELMHINKEIDDIYENLKQTKYVLHAIIIHQGYADSGHYFSYIYSQDQKKWYKFNDIQVQEEQESIVMKQAVGDGRSSAYCLVYVKESLINNQLYQHTFELMSDNDCIQKITEITTSQGVKKKQIVIDLLNLDPDSPVQQTQLKVSNSQNKELQPVKNLVQESLKAEIQSQNRQQQFELQQYRQLQLADMIVENYNKRFSFINEYIRKTYEKSKKITSCPPLTNFGVYLRWENENVTNLLKVQLLDCSIQEITNKKMMLQDINKNHILKNRLLNNFESMGEFKSPGKILLSPSEFEFINKQYTKYLTKVASGYALLQAYDYILNNNVIQSFDYFHYIQNNTDNNNQNDYFYRMSRDMFKVLLLKSSCSLFNQLDEPNEVILKQIKFILLYSAKLPEGETTLVQIFKILWDYMKYIGNTKLNLQKERLQKVIALLQNHDKLQEQFKEYLIQQEKKFEELDNSLMQKAMAQDKYFWKIEDVNMEIEQQINKVFAQLNQSLREHINFHQSLVKYKKVLDIQERIQYNFQASFKI